jgi:hypothetical protein
MKFPVMPKKIRLYLGQRIKNSKLRDADFNGQASYDIETGLSLSKALQKLKQRFLADYPNAFFVKTKEEFEDAFGVGNDMYTFSGAGYYDVSHFDRVYRTGEGYEHNGRRYGVGEEG